MTQLYLDKVLEASQVFTPGWPVSQKDLFSGRKDALERILEAIVSPGRHPIIFGQRGVGKTSLANIMSDLITNVLAVYASCDSSDTFGSIWNRLLENTTITFREKAWGLSREEVEKKTSLRAFIKGDTSDVTPSQVAELLGGIVGEWTIFIIDEFDKVTNRAARARMADLIKHVSDTNKWVSIVVVGVGPSISTLIGHHPSIERNLLQVELPTMSDDEIKGIVRQGCNVLRISVTDEVLSEVAQLANGFPHYAHLLGLSSVKVCFKDETDQLDMDVFTRGCDLAIQDAIEKYREAFSSATATTKASRYPSVLCACAFARHNERGVFRATDVVDAMWQVFRELVTVQAVATPLGRFCAQDRGRILEKVPVGNRSHYRFTDPMMRPFLKIRAKGLLSS